MSSNIPKSSQALFACLLALISCGAAWAGGLYLPQVVSPVSMGTAGVANVVNDGGADAAYTNPAGMTGLDVDTFSGGAQALIPSIKFDSSEATAGGKDGGNAGNVAVVPGLFLVKVLSPDTRFGVSVVAPLGGGYDYGKDFVGRYQGYKVQLTGISITPALAWRITDRLSVGGGLSFLYSVLELELALNQSAVDPLVTDDAQVLLDDIDDWSYQGTVGMQYRVTDRLLFGAIYRSKSKVELEGDIKFSNLQVPILKGLTSNIDKAELDWDYPQMVEAAIRFQAAEHVELMVNANWQDWSQFGDFGLSLDSGPGGASINKPLDIKWKDTWHVGGAIAYLSDRHLFTLGAGYDSSPVDDGDRLMFLPLDEQISVSAGWTLKNNTIGSWSYSLAGGFAWLGDGKIDQVAQGERFKGEFDQNYIVSVAGALKYLF